jgi:Cof subfamily protein (haloacid dehalogenase superfamily)
MSTIKIRCRIFATDLDGTVLAGAEKGCYMPERTKKALGDLHASGVTVVLASGRMHESMRMVASSMDFKGPIISYNGAMTRDADDSLLHHQPLEASLSDEVVDYAEVRGIPLNFYHEGRIYARRFDPWWDLYEGRTSSPMHEVESLRAYLGKEPTKLLMISTAERIRALELEFKDRLKGRANVLVSSDEYLEFMSLGVDKGAALERLAKHLGVDRREIVAAGDGFNDIEMLRYAGVGVAIANGREALKAEADHVVASPEEGGVAAFIEKYLL